MVPLLTCIVTADRPPYEVTFTDKRAKELRVTIKNIGDTDAYNISWLMYYPSSFEHALGRLEHQMDGVIPHLPPGSSAIVTTGPIFGFCLRGEVMVYIDGYCLLFGTKNIIGTTVVDPNLVRYKDEYFSTPNGLFFGVTNGTREIRAFIENTRIEYAFNVKWVITFSCYPGNRKPMQFSGVIDRIGPQERAYIGTGPIFGFHPWADVYIYVNDYGPAHGYQDIIGSFVIFPRLMPNH